MKKHNLLSGALVLSVGSMLAKVFSAIYRIVLTRILGGEGIGLYQLIFPIYSLCVVFATAGLPMAISKVVSKHKNNEKKVIKKCFLFTSIIGLTLSFLLAIFSKGLATLQGQRELTICYLILSPTILIISWASVLRGYFQGKHNFIPSSVSNILEQFIKLVVGLVLSLSLISLGILPAIIGAVVGIVLSEVLSLIILVLYIKKEKIQQLRTENISIKELTKDIVPITLSNLVLPISSFIDSILVVNLLTLNFSGNVSVFLFGLESGAVSSLVSIPTIFSFAVASVILPNLTNSKHTKNKNFKLNLAIKIVLIISLPCAIAFILFPNKLLDVLYQNRLNCYGYNGLKIAGKLLSISGFGIVFFAVNQLYSSSLQAVDERYVATRNLTIAVLIKLFLQVLFLPSKTLNIYALALSNTVCYVLVMVLNHAYIKTHFEIDISYNFWCKLIFSCLMMILSIIAILALNNLVINTIIAILIAMIIYLYSLIKIDIFSKKEKAMFKYKM